MVSFRQWRSCENKKQYQSQEEAREFAQKYRQLEYRCKFCKNGIWREFTHERSKTLNIDRKTEREWFKELCYSDIALGDFLSKFSLNPQQKEKYLGLFYLACEKNKCRYCGNLISPNDFTVTVTYHGEIFAACHINCKVNGEREEAYEIQLIDSGCNDCFFFKRNKQINDGVWNSWTGWCNKLNKETRAYPKKFQGLSCFKHRCAEDYWKKQDEIKRKEVADRHQIELYKQAFREIEAEKNK